MLGPQLRVLLLLVGQVLLHSANHLAIEFDEGLGGVNLLLDSRESALLLEVLNLRPQVVGQRLASSKRLQCLWQVH